MKKTLIIAEAGVNHNGDLKLAYRLIDEAKNASVDIVKFQSFKANNIASKNANKADYQNQTTDSTESQLEMLQKLELSENDHDLIINYCKQKNIEFLSTPFDLESIQLLVSKGITIGKIPSGEITNYPYLVAMAKAFPTIIMSTGMCTTQEIDEAIQVLYENGTKKENLTILHCNTEYPTPMKDVNLKAMLHIQNVFGVAVGYSDHTEGIEIPIAAVTLGASVIEKHFTLDKNMQGPDHKASLEPIELKAMVKAIRNVELAINGTEIKEPSESEKKNIIIARKSIVAKTEIKKGELFTEQNITTKRPGNGISAMQWKNVIGKIASKDFNNDELIIC